MEKRIAPEYVLAAAVLERAILDLDTEGAIDSKERRALRRWFRQEKPTHPFSFPAICGYFDINNIELGKAILKNVHKVAAEVRGRRRGALINRGRSGIDANVYAKLWRPSNVGAEFGAKLF